MSKKIIEEVCLASRKMTLANPLVAKIGQPTVLINNAGVVQGKRLLDLSPADVQQFVQ